MIEFDDKDIGDFQQIWEKETGQKITTEIAREYATSLVLLVSIALDPRPP